MVPAGYMYKAVSARPDWLKTEAVDDIYSVSGCVSMDFCEWIDYWKHNRYWLFDSPEIMEKLGTENDSLLIAMKLFYYKVYELEWDEFEEKWSAFTPEGLFPINVIEPKNSVVEGYDIVSFFCNTSSECSPLSCNHLSESTKVNRHCLLDSLEEAKMLLESGKVIDCEDGPYRIFEVHSVNAA